METEYSDADFERPNDRFSELLALLPADKSWLLAEVASASFARGRQTGRNEAGSAMLGAFA